MNATKFIKSFGLYREHVKRETIAVTCHGRTSGFFVSEEDYKEYLRLKTYAQKAYSIRDLSEDTLKSLASSEMDSSRDHLNALMD